MNNRVIEVVEYRESWVEDYANEKKALLSTANAENIVAIHHVGSTSVKGLAAKPIIDIILEVRSLERLDQDNDLLASLGYEAKGEFGIAGRRYFQKGGAKRTHHIHAFLSGVDDVHRHLAFRDYLSAFPEVADEYAALKQEGAASCNNDSDRYCNHKNDFVREHEARAIEWWETSRINASR
ncbi:GrpB family protein [Veronia pacifica]|uniref:GrpB family protein n=1 Tax=Veronia pacifica TaxID=1080227 RepID=A0A1C3EMT8_9GAMM|nr:GrpB family protein [Veronia pacifica]ODA34542.1 hypothetical protein A8L45_06115 [Veronia pacifica]